MTTPSSTPTGPDGPERREPPKLPARAKQSLSSRQRSRGWDTPDEDLRKYRSRWRSGIRRFLQRVVFRSIVRANITQTVKVARRVRAVRGPFVLVANHTSHLDAPMLAEGLPWTQARFLSTGVATDYFFNVWYKRWFVRWLFNAFPVDRDGSRKNSGTSRRLLRTGVPILVFPEGGRQKTGRMSDFKPGGAALAASTGVPIIPAALIGGHEAMPKGRSWPVKGRPPVGVVFGDPLMARDGESVVDYMARARQAVRDLYEDNYEEIMGRPLPEHGAATDDSPQK
jgi:1-acyl-sn-glycerol-3-phosphate acyltransferase